MYGEEIDYAAGVESQSELETKDYLIYQRTGVSHESALLDGK